MGLSTFFAAVALTAALNVTRCPMDVRDIESARNKSVSPSIPAAFGSAMKSCDLKAQPSAQMCRTCRCSMASGVGRALSGPFDRYLTGPDWLDVYAACLADMASTETGKAIHGICKGFPDQQRECSQPQPRKITASPKDKLIHTMNASCPTSAEQYAASDALKSVMKQGSCAKLVSDGSTNAACLCACEVLDKVVASELKANASAAAAWGPQLTAAGCLSNIQAAMQSAFGAKPEATAAMNDCSASCSGTGSSRQTSSSPARGVSRAAVMAWVCTALLVLGLVV